MNKTIIFAIVLLVVVLLMLLFAVYLHWLDWKGESSKVEVYECDALPRHNLVTVKYNNDNSIDFELTTKGESGGILSGAEYVGDSIWIYDGEKSYPENGLYYKFVIYDEIDEEDVKYLELYNKEELIGRYMLIACAVLEG